MGWFFRAVVVLCVSSLGVAAQSWTFSRAGVEYVLDLPSPTWRVVSRVDLHQHLEFVNGNSEANGYLRVSKILVDPGTNASSLFELEERLRLQYLPGYVVCGDCKGAAFRGYLSGATFSYEYINRGSVMAGRVYYLEVDKRTFYALRFTASRDKLASLQEQMDSIARSFRLKDAAGVSR